MEAFISSVLDHFGFDSLLPIQRALLDNFNELISDRTVFSSFSRFPSDLYLWSPTGSGKTLAFALPIAYYLRNCVRGRLTAIVVCPSQQLAHQTGRVFERVLGVQNVLVSGKRHLAEELDILTRPLSPFVLIATPGRLIDYIDELGTFASEVRFVVFDEADKFVSGAMTDLMLPGLWKSCGRPQNAPRCLAQLIADWSDRFLLQKMLVSATLNPTAIELFDLFRPLLVSNNERVVALNARSNVYSHCAGIEEFVVECGEQLETKPAYLHKLLEKLVGEQTLVFVQSRKVAKKLCELLKSIEPEWSVDQCSSGMSAVGRNRVIDKFNRGKVKILVCTDLLARGMDLRNVDCVVQYHVPGDEATYVHRIGRTARAGKTGKAFVLVCGKSEKFENQTQIKNEFNVKVTQTDLSRLKNALSAI